MTPLSVSFRAQVLFLAVGLLAVYGQDQAGRLDVLKGNSGQSACQLKDTIHSTCSSSPSPALNVTPTPTLCTCNNVFFNIWSACSFGSGNNTLPMFSSWLARCTTGSIDLDASAKMKDGGESMIGIDIPVWADIPVPGNTSFDLQEAVVRSVKPSTPKTWTTLQIILPIVSALLGVVLTVIFLKVRSNRGNSPTKSRISVPALPKIPSFIHPRRRVRHLNLDQRSLSEWQIEPPVAPPPSLESAPPHISPDPSVGIPPSPPDTPHRDSTVPGHPSVYSDTSRQSMVAHHEGIPSTSDVYPFGREEQERIQRLPLNQRSTPHTGMLSLPTTTATNTGTWTTGTWTPRTWGDSIRDIRLPKFKRKPVQIVPIEPTERFRIDGSSEGSPSVRQSLASAGQRASGTGGTEIRMSGMGRGMGMGMGMGDVDEIDEDHDHDHPSEGYFESIQEDEDTSLITDEERRGSKNYSAGTKSTHGTSINSRVRIESPTASTVSPHSTMQSGIWPLTNSFVKPKQAPPPLPPVPKLPAPLPPPITPRTHRAPAAPLESGFSLRGNPASSNNNRIMPPILEDQNSIRSGHAHELVINLNNLSLSSSSQSRPTPTRSLSEGSETSVQSNGRRPLPSPAHSSSSSSHQRSASAASRGPLPDTPPLYFNNLNNAHRRSGSNNSLSSIQRTLSPPPRLDMLDDPLFMPDRRGLSADDTASFYLTADPPGHGQSQSQSSGSGSRTDPGAFYPGAVRGAGYG